MKTIIAGSRTITDYSLLLKAIKIFKYSITEVICGLSSGVDNLGKFWAISNNVPVTYVPANWKKYGKRAGPIRNAKMAKLAEAMIILWDGKSKGTKNMLEEGRKQGLHEFLYII